MSNIGAGGFTTEHIFELRHNAAGKFLDIRGEVANHIQREGFFNDWRIQENTISFFNDNGDTTISKRPLAVIAYNKIAFIIQYGGPFF